MILKIQKKCPYCDLPICLGPSQVIRMITIDNTRAGPKVFCNSCRRMSHGTTPVVMYAFPIATFIYLIGKSVALACAGSLAALIAVEFSALIIFKLKR